jgi:hypothetical protein
VCHPEAVRHSAGNATSCSFLPRNKEKICPSIWLMGIIGIFKSAERVPATVIPVRSDGINQG